MACLCPRPVPSLNTARHGDMCLKCAKRIVGDWVADDRTMSEFFDRLREALNLGLELDPGHPFEFFRRQCLNREMMGRARFGYRYLERDNPAEGKEEAADDANYACFEILKSIRAGVPVSPWLMEVAICAAKAHQAWMRYEAERRGTPSFNVDE